MRQTAFRNVRYAHVCTLLDVMGSTTSVSLRNIRRLFLEDAEGFEEVLSFSSRIGLVAREGGTLRLKADVFQERSQSRTDEILARLVSTRNRYRTELLDFLDGFRLQNGEVSYTPLDRDRSAESGVRNFLIEVGVVKGASKSQKYILSRDFVHLFALAKESCTPPISRVD